MPRRKPVIDVDDPTGRGQTTDPLPAWVDAPPTIPDEPFVLPSPRLGSQLDDPRMLLLDAQQALRAMRAERDEARALANAFRRDRDAERERSTIRFAHAVSEQLGHLRQPEVPNTTSIANAVVRRLAERGLPTGGTDQHVIQHLVKHLQAAHQGNMETTANWGKYLDAKLIALAHELRAVAAAVHILSARLDPPTPPEA